MDRNQKDEVELGFGTRAYKRSIRFIRRDGALNVKRLGLRPFENLDAYNWLISVKSRTLFMVIVAWYLAINCLFATLFYLTGPENFGGIDHSSRVQQFMSLFFFSAQTITTLGYGHIYPLSNAASIVAAIESLLGLLSFAIATGIIFGRFSRPRAHVLYSENILIAPYREGEGLMFRISNQKQYELIEAEASVNVAMTNPLTGKREFHSLDLEINHINFLPLSWTIVHPLNDKSPIFGMGKDELDYRDVEVMILIKAINDTFSQTVFSRHSYKAEDLIANAKFKPLKQEAGSDGRVRITVTDIHQFDKLDNN